MISNRSMLPGPVISELTYADVREAARWLCQAFGFTERLRIADHRVQLTYAGGSLVATERRSDMEANDDTAHSMMVVVADADSHCRRAAEAGATILSHPADYPFGERQYTVEDIGGHRWTFSQSIADIDPAVWGGELLETPECAPKPKGYKLLQKIMPELPLTDVTAGLAHYRDILGFRVNYAQDDIAVMDRDAVRILLIARTAGHTGIGSCYVYVDNADTLYAELIAKGANVRATPVSQPWGLREFPVLDTEGNRITFGQPFE